MSKDKIYLTVIVLLAIALIAGCVLQTQRIKRLSVSEIIVPKEGLKFKTEDGKVLAAIVAYENGGVLCIFNNQERMGAIISVDEDGGDLSIFNNQGNPTASLATDKDGGGGLCIYNNQEKRTTILAAGENGGVLSIYNNQGKVGAGMLASKDGGFLGIYDNQQNLIWSKP